MSAVTQALPASSGFIQEQYQRHGDRVFRLCLRMGAGNRAWAEDVTQDVFVRLLEHLDAFDQDGDAGGWLMTVGYRLCVDRLRRERKIWPRMQRLMGAITEPGENERFGYGESTTKVLAGIAKLNPKERAVFVLVQLEERSQTEAARVLSISDGYASKLLSRANAKIRAHWGRRE